MELLIDTTQQGKIVFGLFGQNSRLLARQEKNFQKISEHLLPELAGFLKKHKVKIKELKKILVNPGPGGFSATRTGVATANALAYALGIPVAEWPAGKIKQLILPKYNKKPNITYPSTRSARSGTNIP